MDRLIEGVPELLKLHLASGQERKDGFLNVDISEAAKPDKVCDLLTFPLPWAEDSVSEILTEHFLEHIPASNVGETIRFAPNGNLADVSSHEFMGKDFLICFMNECYRILKPGGIMRVVVPAASSDRAYQDPTHRRFIPRQFFAYLEAPWRKQWKLDHMDFTCDFETTVTPLIDADWSHRNEETKWFGMERYRNIVWDYSVVLKAVKPIRT